MRRRTALTLILALAAGGVAHAQYGGGPGGGGRGGGDGRGGGGESRSGGGPQPPRKPQTPVNQLQFVGVVTAIDKDAGRITIA